MAEAKGIRVDLAGVRLRRKLPALERRARVLREIRRFFDDRGFLAVETPVRLRAPAPEVHIDAEPAGAWFLRTSPELHMKRLLAAGARRLYQLGPCFRRGERGDRHHPEFTLLEWYRADADYADILADAKTLILHLARTVTGGDEITYQGRRIDLVRWTRIPVEEAFMLHAGWNPVRAYEADRFDLDLVDKVEPALPADVPVVLTDYPAAAAALARRKPADPRVAERWELYIGGLELANAYSELTDAGEQAERFRHWSAARAAAGREAYPPDQAFLDALAGGMPPCGGIALGVDRLVMLLTDAATLDEVIAFRE